MAHAPSPSSDQGSRATAAPAGPPARPASRRSVFARCGAVSAVVFLILMSHALLFRPDAHGSLDVRLMIQVQRVDLPQLGRWLNEFERLTDSGGAIRAWFVTLAVFATLRWWLPALAVAGLPLAGVISETISRVLVPRTRPHLDVLRHTSENYEERSFPSGHVVGAVLLYGLIWHVVARRVRFAPQRWLIQAACGAVIVLTGFDRVWDGAHWPTDVIAAYALGFALLVGLILICEWVEREAAWIAFGVGPEPAAAGGTLGLVRLEAAASNILAATAFRWRWLVVRLATPTWPPSDRPPEQRR